MHLLKLNLFKMKSETKVLRLLFGVKTTNYTKLGGTALRKLVSRGKIMTPNNTSENSPVSSQQPFLLDYAVNQQLADLNAQSSFLPAATSDKLLEQSQENTRATLAKRLVLGYSIVVFLIFGNILADKIGWYASLPTQFDQSVLETKQRQDQAAKELFTLVLTSATGLLGSALGFYFSSREHH